MRNWIKALGSARKPAARDPRGAHDAARSHEDHAEGLRQGAHVGGSANGVGGASARPQKAATALAAQVHDLELELSRQRERTAAAATEAQKEATLARRALEEAGAARLERDEYRRVLAAAIANEKRALEDARAAREAYELVEGRLSARLAEEVYARGIADGRVRELERSKAEVLTRHVHELAEVRDREWAEREERRREVQRLVFELGEARASSRALEARLGRERQGPAARGHQLSGGVARGVAVFAAIVALALAPAALLAAFSPARAGYLTLALGLGPWALTLATLGFGLVALGCAVVALRSTRAAVVGPAASAPIGAAGTGQEAHPNRKPSDPTSAGQPSAARGAPSRG
jgi:hypothetical protein